MTDSARFFISPDRVLIPLENTPLQTVSRYPEKFGLDHGSNESGDQPYNEPIELEGDELEDVLGSLVCRGWTRIHWYPDHWSIKVPRLSGEMRGILRAFGAMALRGDPPFSGEVKPYEPVRVTGWSTGRAIDLTFADLVGEDSWHLCDIPRLHVNKIGGYVPKKTFARPVLEEKVKNLLEQTGKSRKKKVLLYLSAGPRIREEYAKLPYDLVILSDFAFQRFDVLDEKVVLMASKNVETIQWLRETGISVNCVLTLDCGCNEGGNTGCENSPERFERLAPVLADKCLYVYDHTTIACQYRTSNLTMDWFTGFIAEPADVQSIETVVTVVNDSCNIVKLKRIKKKTHVKRLQNEADNEPV
jgi:hypothetical protein